MSRLLPDLEESTGDDLSVPVEEDDGSLWWGGHEDDYDYDD